MTYAKHPRIIILSILLMLCPFASLAQVPVSLTPEPKIQFFSNAGFPLANGCVFTYQAGTNNPQATYTDSTGTAQNTNPVILDAGGRANIWLTSQGYKIVLFSTGGVNCASGAQIWSVDNVTGQLGLLSLANTWTAQQKFSQPIVITPSVNQIVLGTAPNQTTLNFPAPAGNVTLTTPNTTDTLVGRNTTDTLNNKSLNSPTIATPTLNGNVAGTSLQGTDPKLLSSGTVAGLAATLCTDANGGATTVGCSPPAAANLGCTNFTPVTVSNNNAQQNLMSCTINPGALSQGSLLEVDLQGIESAAVGQTLIINVSLGGGTACTTQVTEGVANNQPWNAVMKLFVLTSGAGGTMNMSCQYFSTASGGGVIGPLGVLGTPTLSVNTTIANTLLVTEQMSVVNVGNSVTQQGLKAVIF